MKSLIVRLAITFVLSASPALRTIAVPVPLTGNAPVPANWEIEGFSRPTFQERGNNASDDIGLYRRWVEVPAKFSGQQVLWHFDGIYDGAEVFVNGQRVGYHESGFTAFDVDVTRALNPGQRNLFAVRVYKKTPSGNLDKGDFWCLGGNRNGVLLWNGVPIKCTGTCRHEEFSPYGHALTEACWQTDVALMKAANINSIRTSHYNHSARFMELCDEAGFYVLDEVPFCWVGGNGPQADINNTISVTADVYLAGSDELKGQIRYTLDVGADAQAEVAWNLVWKGTDASALEAGLKFLLSAATDRMSWLSESRWTEYPPGHIGNPTGSVTSKDISFRSSKRDVHWIALSGGGKYGLVALGSGKPLHARGHAETNGTMLFLSSAMGVPSDYSSNATPGYDIRLTPDNPIGGAFCLRIAANKQ
jgi:hypothetical protein